MNTLINGVLRPVLTFSFVGMSVNFRFLSSLIIPIIPSEKLTGDTFGLRKVYLTRNDGEG